MATLLLMFGYSPLQGNVGLTNTKILALSRLLVMYKEFQAGLPVAKELYSWVPSILCVIVSR